MTPTQFPVQSRHGTQLHLEREGEVIRVLFGKNRHLAFSLPAGVPALHFATNILALTEMGSPDAALHFIADTLGVDVEIKPRLPEVEGAVVEWPHPMNDRAVRAVRVADGWVNARTAQKCYPPNDSKVVFAG